MSSQEIDELCRAIVEGDLAFPNELEACTGEEIDRVQEVAGGMLPPIYQEFLRRIGRGAGKYAADVDMFFPEILNLRGHAEELLSEVGLKLPTQCFVFSMLNRCAFLCFDPRLEDPSVLRYVEGDADLSDRGSLSAHFLSEAGQIRHRRVKPG